MELFIEDYFSCLGFKAIITKTGYLYQFKISAGGDKSFVVPEFKVAIDESGKKYCIIEKTAISMKSFREQAYRQIVNLPIDYPISTYNENDKMTYAHNGTREYIEPPNEGYNNIYGNVYDFNPSPVFFDWYDRQIAKVTAIIHMVMIKVPMPIRDEIMFCLPMQSIRK